MLCYFSHSHNNYGRDPHSDLNSLPPERQRLANQKLGIFTILFNSSWFTELSFGFASVTIWYLAPYQILEVANQGGFLLQKQSAAHFVRTNIFFPLVLLSLFIKLLGFSFLSFPLRVSHSQDLPTLSYGAALPFHPLYFPNRMLPEGEEKMRLGINQLIVWFPKSPSHLLQVIQSVGKLD